MRYPITIVAIDTDPASHELTRFAVKQSLLGLDVEGVLFFGGKPLGLGEKFVETQRFDSMDSYSEFVLKCMWPFVSTDYILIVHWDGFIANPERWQPEFLKYDYIGAPWVWAEEEFKVGNGGFCLRSRKLLNACKDVKIRRAPEIPYGGIEDIVICRMYRNYLEEQGLRFAPVDLAAQFSFETGQIVGQPFGFHGPANMPIFVPEKYLLELAPALKKKIGPGPIMDLFKAHCQLKNYQDLLTVMNAPDATD